jgi:hypothetical protein
MQKALRGLLDGRAARSGDAADHAKRADSLETDASAARKQADDLLKRAAEFEAAAAQLDGDAK